MASSPHQYVGKLKKTDDIINKARDVLSMSNDTHSPIKPYYSAICRELGECRGELLDAIKGLTKDSDNKDKYAERIKIIDGLLNEFTRRERQTEN